MTAAIEAEIGTAEAARLIGRSDRRVRQMVASGHIAAQAAGGLRIVDVVAGHQRVLDEERAKRSSTATDQRLRDARIEEVALRNEERSGKLIAEARAEAVGVVDELAGALRTDLLSVPAKATADPTMRRKIHDAIEDAFRAAAARAGREGCGPGAAGRPMAPPRKARAGRLGAAEQDVPVDERAPGSP